MKHRLDETLVITVMVVAGLSSLLLFAGYASNAGLATSTAGLNLNDVIYTLSQATSLDGTTGKCSVECAKQGKVCILAHQDGQLTSCNAKIRSNYNCLCAQVEKETAPVIIPKPAEPVVLEGPCPQGPDGFPICNDPRCLGEQLEFPDPRLDHQGEIISQVCCQNDNQCNQGTTCIADGNICVESSCEDGVDNDENGQIDDNDLFCQAWN